MQVYDATQNAATSDSVQGPAGGPSNAPADPHATLATLDHWQALADRLEDAAALHELESDDADRESLTVEPELLPRSGMIVGARFDVREVGAGLSPHEAALAVAAEFRRMCRVLNRAANRIDAAAEREAANPLE